MCLDGTKNLQHRCITDQHIDNTQSFEVLSFKD